MAASGFVMRTIAMIGVGTNVLVRIGCGALGWILIAPFAALIPRKKGWVAVVGREEGKFLDNAKHFFIQASDLTPDFRVVFVARDEGVMGMIRGAGRESMLVSSLATAWFLLQCEYVVVDSVDWVRCFRRYLLVRARKVQLWHGIPLKLIEFDRWQADASKWRPPVNTLVRYARYAVYWLTGRLVSYDVLVATSRMTADGVFRSALLSSERLVSGYPRNGFVAMSTSGRDLAWSNVDNRISLLLEKWVASGRKIVLAAPTFRDSGDAPFSLGQEELRMLDAFCEKKGCEFIFKLHPADRSALRGLGEHIHWFDPDGDIYPVLPFTHALVTDYSSIYFDYLLIDKPILFYRADDYSRTGRGIYQHMAEMIPGPSATSWDQLLGVLERQLADDTWTQERGQVRQACFEDQDQNLATQRILAVMRSFPRKAASQ